MTWTDKQEAGLMRNYKKIRTWQMADDLTVGIYELSAIFPKSEVYGLTSQLRRASYSVPANIAEGAALDSKRHYLHFLYIARGSLAETEYFVHLAQRLGYLSKEDQERMQEQINGVFSTLHGLITAVEQENGTVARNLARFSSTIMLGLALLPRLLS
ncbi:MAG: four helix bundle protein [bacterium]